MRAPREEPHLVLVAEDAVFASPLRNADVVEPGGLTDEDPTATADEVGEDVLVGTIRPRDVGEVALVVVDVAADRRHEPVLLSPNDVVDAPIDGAAARADNVVGRARERGFEATGRPPAVHDQRLSTEQQLRRLRVLLH
jgi:hypothetical protein